MMQSSALLSSLLLSLLLVLHSGCSSTGSGKDSISGNYANPATWLSAAEAYERKGDLQNTLFNLKLARTVSSQDAKINLITPKPQLL